jgi:glycosyltransferase involved in cell wall biosynthesis
MKKDLQTVSVVMATYNGAQYLKEQIDSILNQTYPIYELIIQDDGSTDETVAIAKDYAKRYPVVKVFINEKNLGLNQNFKTAAMRASGDFVAISDQDDVWYKDKLERQLAAISNRDVCSSAYNLDLVAGETETRYYKYNIERLLFFSFICGHTMLCRRDFVQNPDNWQDYMWYDWSLSLHASLGNGLVQVEEPLVWHRYHSNEVSATIWRKYAAIGEHSSLYPYLHGLKAYRKWLKDDNRRAIYTHLQQVTSDGRFPLVNRFCNLLLKDDLISILRLCRLCQKHRGKIYFRNSTNGLMGWIRGFFFPMIYSCSTCPYIFYKKMSVK